MSEKRRDSKGRILRTGESQRPDGRYAYKYVDATGRPQLRWSDRPGAHQEVCKAENGGQAHHRGRLQNRYQYPDEGGIWTPAH